MVPVGIVAALDFELRALADSPSFAVRRCGVAGAGCQRAVRDLADAGSRLVVAWGTAGSLSPRLRVGDVYLPSRVLAGDGTGHETDDRWRAGFAAAASGACSVRTGLLLHSSRIVAEPGDKRRLAGTSGAEAVDMESGPIAAACMDAGLPFLSVRVILDELDDRLPAEIASNIGSDGALRRGSLLAALAGRPGAWADVVRLARRYRRARSSLGIAAGALARWALEAS